MTHYIEFESLPDYPKEYISKSVLRCIEKDGLIEPLIILPDGNIHPMHREHFMAFKQIARSLGDKGTKTIIATYWFELSSSEKIEWDI